ncbi:MAG TPA: hypothetical protein PK926_09970 [Spirochaetota bacterium]|nr:hypothetical protein [Spirochaetota bacterium]HPI88853.1 hypothetical protein [Spirochaetota bacterium]HPR47659.1 hypothetical protein [Spirochaetota bacterium]
MAIDFSKVQEIKLFDADTLDYAGSIIVTNERFWEYRDVTDAHLLEITQGLPLKGVLTSLINFNLVYEVVDCYLN